MGLQRLLLILFAFEGCTIDFMCERCHSKGFRFVLKEVALEQGLGGTEVL